MSMMPVRLSEKVAIAAERIRTAMMDILFAAEEENLRLDIMT